MQQRAFVIRRTRRVRGFALACVLLLPSAAACPSVVDAVDVHFLPDAILHPPSFADPRQVGFGVQWLEYTDTAVPDTGDSRVAVKAGGQFGIARFGPPDADGHAWQVDLLGGINAQFDADHSLDNIGWDGWYGLFLTTGRPGGTAFKLGLLHDSSHRGDEYIERTGKGRIGYTRHEVAAGVSVPAGELMRVYAEAGWGYDLSNRALMEPGRVQAGMVYGPCQGSRGDCRGWYGAVDLSSSEERDWQLDSAVQAGVAARKGGRTWRFGVEWHRGPPPIGEFFQYTEHYFGLGIWLDV